MKIQQDIQGCLLGTAIGDAIGLPYEGLKRQRVERMLKGRDLKHRLFLGRGMCSDDTEHTVMLAQAYLQTGGDPEAMANNLAWRLRWWLLRLPAGVGLGTLRACLKLWLGFGPKRSGVNSAGNGPAMRSALLGIVAKDDAQLREMVKAATQLTHTDPRAEEGALVVANLAFIFSQQVMMLTPAAKNVLPSRLLDGVHDEMLKGHVKKVLEALETGQDPAALFESMGLENGVTGFVNHTVPAAIYCALKHSMDYRKAVTEAVKLGGDTDTVAAIVGALVGIRVGVDGIPKEWREGLWEWPCHELWLMKLGSDLARSCQTNQAMTPPRLNVLALCLRNLLFVGIVLFHGFRRLLPPY